MTPSRLASEFMPIVLALVLVSCGGSEAGPTSTTGSTSMVTTTAAPSTTSTTAPTSTSSDRSASADDLPTTLTGGTYLVGEEIRTGFWVSDQCGCPWYVVDEMGNSTQGSGEDAEVRDSDHEIELGSCTWTWDG